MLSAPDFRALQRKVEQLTTLISLNTVVSAKTDLHAVLRAVGLAARQAADAEASALLLLDVRTRELYFEVAEGEKSRKVREVRVPLGQGIAGWVAERGEAQIVNDPYADPRFFPEADKRSGFTTRNLLCVPIRLKHPEPGTSDQTVGVLEVVNKRIGTFGPDDRDVVELVANQAAVAIENAKLVRSLREALDRLQAAQSSVIHGERLAFLGQLSTGIVHDLKNPLTALLGWVELLEEDAENSAMKERLGDVARQLKRMEGIVSSLLAYARPAEEMATYDFDSVAARAVELVRHLPAARRAPIRREGDPLPPLEGNAREIEQVLVNLLSNAVDAAPDDGAPHPIVLRQRADVSTGWVDIEVEDAGAGIAPEHLARLFTPFFTTKPEGQGTGMGLAVVQGIIARHRGTIRAASPAPSGRGAVFTIRLPVRPQDASPPAPEARRILVVDDDALHLRIVSDFLGGAGFEPVCAKNADEALGHVEATGGRPFAICLLDMVMPGRSGLETLRELRRLRPELPVFIVTAKPDLPEVSQALQAGASEVLVKPLTPEYLLNRVLVKIEAALR